MVNQYNNSNNEKAIFQIYNSTAHTFFILCIVTDLMRRVYEKIRQSGELYYFNTSAVFDLFNTSISLLYINCSVGILLLDLFLISDESEITIEYAINLLKIILLKNAFYGCKPQLSPKVIITDDSNAECNVLEICWPTCI